MIFCMIFLLFFSSKEMIYSHHLLYRKKGTGYFFNIKKSLFEKSSLSPFYSNCELIEILFCSVL